MRQKKMLSNSFKSVLRKWELPLLKSRILIVKCPNRKIYKDYTKEDIQVMPMKHRSLLQVSGRDTVDFLQGLFTNDVKKLPTEKCMYTMMLNRQGRVEHDIVMFWSKNDSEENILLDCQTESIEKIVATFKMYKLRKKVDFEAKEDYQLWQVQLNKQMSYSRNLPQTHEVKDFDSVLSPNFFQDDMSPLYEDKVVHISRDPRLSWLGWRLISTSQPCSDNYIASENLYYDLRYYFGIPEGPQDLPPGKCLPFESNLDYMNGISFNKGCYLGQELTARSYFTGVIRKRLIPVYLQSGDALDPGSSIFDTKGTSCGKFRSISPGNNANGLALMKLSRQNSLFKTLNGGTLSANKTYWWPE